MTRPTRRVVVALDATAQSREAARAAAELARRLGAELAGLFVEDTNVLRLGGLPPVRELRLPEGIARPIDLATLETELRAVAARAREALAHEASVERVAWSFQVRRGSLAQEVLAAASEGDLLVVAEDSPLLSGDLLERLLDAAPTLVLVKGIRSRPRRR